MTVDLMPLVQAAVSRCGRRAAAMTVAAIFAPSLAQAAEAVAVQSPSIDLTAIIIAIVGGVFAVIQIVAKAITASHIKDAAARQVVDKALDNSLGAIQQAAQGEVAALRPHVAIPGIPASLTAGVQYVLDHAGPETQRLGITPQAVADKITARIGLSNIATNLAVSSSAAPVVAKPLDPVPEVLPPQVTAVVTPAPAT